MKLLSLFLSFLLISCQPDPPVPPMFPPPINAFVLPDSVLFSVASSDIVGPWTYDTIRFYYTYSGTGPVKIVQKGIHHDYDWALDTMFVWYDEYTYDIEYLNESVSIKKSDINGLLVRHSLFFFSNGAYRQPDYMLEHISDSTFWSADSLVFTYFPSGLLRSTHFFMDGVSGGSIQNFENSGNLFDNATYSRPLYSSYQSHLPQYTGFDYMRLIPTSRHPVELCFNFFYGSKNLLSVNEMQEFEYTFANNKVSTIEIRDCSHDCWFAKYELWY